MSEENEKRLGSVGSPGVGTDTKNDNLGTVAEAETTEEIWAESTQEDVMPAQEEVASSRGEIHSRGTIMRQISYLAPLPGAR